MKKVAQAMMKLTELKIPSSITASDCIQRPNEIPKIAMEK
jgi:hypothetical protein